MQNGLHYKCYQIICNAVRIMIPKPVYNQYISTIKVNYMLQTSLLSTNDLSFSCLQIDCVISQIGKNLFKSFRCTAVQEKKLIK